MQVEIDFNKSIESNASSYYDKGKEAKAKAERIQQAIEVIEYRLSQLDKQIKQKQEIKQAPKKWHEKFHWFFSSNGFLVLAGRDMKSNELLIKRYMKPDDLYFHAEIQGAAHCIVKTEGNEVDEETKKEAAVFAANFSKAWASGLSSIDVYSVKPEQVSKQAPTGTSLSTGAFMIYGKREWFRNISLGIAIGIEKKDDYYKVISGPKAAIKKHSAISFEIFRGEKKKSEIAQELRGLFEKNLNLRLATSIDEIVSMLPASNLEIGKRLDKVSNTSVLTIND
ncbi:MAG: NFACT RNA binding domain-containing protein [archaeon]